MSLAKRQQELVEALVAGGPLPAGFDEERVTITAGTLVRKRAAEVAMAWPVLAAALGPRYSAAFFEWAQGRPSAGAQADGLQFAGVLRDAGQLPEAARDELAVREVRWRIGKDGGLARRRWPAVRRRTGGVIVQIGGRTWSFVRAR